MENLAVTLTISSDNNELLNYISDISISNGISRQTIESDVYRNATEVYLGKLSELKDSELIVITSAQRSENNLNNNIAKINYEIKYGQTTVEKMTVEDKSIKRTSAIFNFRFRFCPRHPFC